MVDPCYVVFASIDRSSCIIACIYIPPKNSRYYWTTTKVLDFFKTLRLLVLHGTHSPVYMVITGELIFSCTNWRTMESTDPSESLFLDNLLDLGFQQILHESTGTSLDVFLFSLYVKHINSSICLELEKLLYDDRNKKFSDHVPYSSGNLVEYEAVQAVSWKSRSFSNVDWELVNKVISENTFDPFCLSNPNVLLSEWYIWINRTMDKTIPVKTKHRKFLPPWVSSETSNHIQRHNTLLNKLIKKKVDIANKASSSLSEISLISLESKVDSSASALNERLQFDQEDYAEKTFDGWNNSDAFKQIKIVKEPQDFPPVINWCQESASTHLEKANVFNHFFARIFMRDQSLVPCNRTECLDEPMLCTAVKVSDILSSLNIKKATGPDEIPNNFLENCSVMLRVSFSLLFRNLLLKGVFPTQWKTSIVCPLYKEGDRSSAEQYRPNSFLSYVTKILERVVFNQIYEKLSFSSLTSNTGSGRKDEPQCSCCRSSIKCINPTTNVTLVVKWHILTSLKLSILSPIAS